MIAFLYAPIILLVGLVFVFKNKNKNNEVLIVSAYIVGVEVLLRMTNTMYLHEFGKYSILLFSIIGIFFSGLDKKSIFYLLFLLILLPAVFIGISTLSFDTDIRKAIIFNILGPLTLAVASIYCYDKRIEYQQFQKIFLAIAYPLVTMLVYIFLYTPNLKEAITGTDSNFSTSGGFGPNQVSTVLGLGMFIFFVLSLLYSKSKITQVVYFSIALLFGYRGLLTFSRGGLLVGLFITVIFLFVIFKNTNVFVKSKLLLIGIGFVFISSLIFTFTANQTGGLLVNRYQSKDAIGREKSSKFSGREKLAQTELEIFLENPVFGIGIGRNKEERLEKTGDQAASHNEITRLLSEHGVFGIFALLLLVLIPFIQYFKNKQHIFLVPFFFFWFLTINHAAMRIAAPAFIYALTLLNVKINASKKPPLHRQHP